MFGFLQAGAEAIAAVGRAAAKCSFRDCCSWPGQGALIGPRCCHVEAPCRCPVPEVLLHLQGKLCRSRSAPSRHEWRWDRDLWIHFLLLLDPLSIHHGAVQLA